MFKIWKENAFNSKLLRSFPTTSTKYLDSKLPFNTFVAVPRI